MTRWWVTEYWAVSPAFLMSRVFWSLLSVTLHELGHGWAAIRRGDDTPIHTGHMTWNPIVHMGTFGMIMFAMFGLAFGAMPVDPSRLRGRYADAYVSFAGPIMNLSLAVVCLVACALWKKYGLTLEPTPFATNLGLFLLVGMMTNTALFLFNLVPVPPLDGSSILADFSTAYRNFLITEHGKMFAFIGFPVLFLFVGKYVVYAAQDASLWMLAHTIKLLG